MQAFSTLTRRGQIRRLRRLAQSVLPEYDLKDPKLTYLGHGYNTTFCIHAEDGTSAAQTPAAQTPARQTLAAQSATYDPHRYLLRVHRPGWHGSENDTRPVVQSEMLWLSALRQETDLAVPEPLQTKDGTYSAVGHDAGIPDARVCSALRWVKERFQAQNPKPLHLYRVGAMTAQLHSHAAAWTIPKGFVRHQWHWEAFFGNAITFTDLSIAEVWEIVPSPYRAVLEDAANALQPVMEELGQGPEVWGLIHGDLHLDNVIFANDEARPIDFDDCGFGHWIYDIAVALWELVEHDHWPALRQAFLDGYAQHRPLPHHQLPYLQTFMAAREALIGLGIAARTHDVPEYRKYLEEDMGEVAGLIELIGQKGASE